MLKICENYIFRKNCDMVLHFTSGCVHTWHNKYLLCVEYKSLSIQYGI